MFASRNRLAGSSVDGRGGAGVFSSPPYALPLHAADGCREPVNGKI